MALNLAGIGTELWQSSILRGAAIGSGLGSLYGVTTGVAYGDYFPLGRTIGYGAMWGFYGGVGAAAFEAARAGFRAASKATTASESFLGFAEAASSSLGKNAYQAYNPIQGIFR